MNIAAAPGVCIRNGRHAPRVFARSLVLHEASPRLAYGPVDPSRQLPQRFAPSAQLLTAAQLVRLLPCENRAKLLESDPSYNVVRI